MRARLCILGAVMSVGMLACNHPRHVFPDDSPQTVLDDDKAIALAKKALAADGIEPSSAEVLPVRKSPETMLVARRDGHDDQFYVLFRMPSVGGGYSDYVVHCDPLPPGMVCFVTERE
jgi:hypothetical protein